MNKPYATGICVHFGYAGQGKSGWWAELVWKAGEFATRGFLEGSVKNRYAEPTLAEAINLVLSASPESLSLHLAIEDKGFIFYDGEVNEVAPPEAQQSIRVECERVTKLASGKSA